MHAAYTMPDETGSFGGARYLFVVTRFDHRKAQCYLQTQEAYTLHKHMRRCFLHRKMLSKLVDSKGIADLCQADLIDRSGIELQRLVSLSADLHRRLYQGILGDTAAQQNGKKVTNTF